MRGKIENAPDKTVFTYMVPGIHGPVACPPEVLKEILPITRPLSSKTTKAHINMESYFRVIENFIIANLDNLLHAVAQIHGTAPPTIQRVEILAEKSGSDYHPAKITAVSPQADSSFAVNVAMTPRGFMRIDSEFPAMQFLGRHFQQKFVPSVFFCGAQSVSGQISSNHPARMFVTEWCDGYHEFHLSRNPISGEIQPKLWESQHRISPLSETELRQIYVRAAHILTYYYDIDTHREIYPWHHAAGDFIVSRTGNKIDVRLIATRQYSPRLIVRHSSDVSPCDAAILFLANLTLRMRLDRSDGIGDILWGPLHSVEDTVLGFVSGLRAQMQEGRVSKSVFEEMVVRLRMLAPDHLADIFTCVIDSYDPSAPDLQIIQHNSAEHVFQVFQALRTMLD
jgi:hypothetical protein